MRRGKQVLRMVAAVMAVACMPPALAQSGSPLQVYAAGSLRQVLTEVAAGYEARTSVKVVLTFGASGLLRERIEKGEPAQLFASADTTQPQRLANAGAWKAPVVFTRNTMCALTGAGIDATPETLLAVLLRADVRVGTSTPRSDPSGDYAWALFARAGTVRPGAQAALEAKALKLTGAADSPLPPAGRGTYAWLMEQGKADVFLTYCTNAVAARREVPALKIIDLPPELQVGAAYGLTVREGAPDSASGFAQYILSAEAQAVFRSLGFGAP